MIAPASPGSVSGAAGAGIVVVVVDVDVVGAMVDVAVESADTGVTVVVADDVFDDVTCVRLFPARVDVVATAFNDTESAGVVVVVTFLFAG